MEHIRMACKTSQFGDGSNEMLTGGQDGASEGPARVAGGRGWAGRPGEPNDRCPGQAGGRGERLGHPVPHLTPGTLQNLNIFSSL